jgi:6-phosphogluconate dehydrogenase
MPGNDFGAAVEARVLSSMKAARVVASRRLHGPEASIALAPEQLVPKLHEALHASKIVSYAQRLALMRAMSEKKGCALDLGAIASIWRGGCIIRARFLNRITEAYRADPGLSNLMLAPSFEAALNRAQAAWCRRRARHWPTTKPAAARGCRRTCCRRSAISSARIRTSGSIGRRGRRFIRSGRR